MIAVASNPDRPSGHARNKATGGIVELFAGLGSVARSFERSGLRSEN